MNEMVYKWEITNRKTGEVVYECFGEFVSYDTAKEDLIKYIPRVKKGIEYNYTIFDVKRQINS